MRKQPAKAAQPEKTARPRPSLKSVTFKLPVELLEQIEAMAEDDERPRSKLLEFACREYVQRHRQQKAAA